MSYAFLAGGILGWAINLFWFATLISMLRNDWSSLSFWIYCLVAAIGGALPIILIKPHADVPVLTAGALIFALLVAWDRFYRRERIIMLGLGEVSVRQAAIFVAALNAVVCFFSCGGWLFTFSMMPDAKTCPPTRRGRVIWALSIAVTDGVLRYLEIRYSMFLVGTTLESLSR